MAHLFVAALAVFFLWQAVVRPVAAVTLAALPAELRNAFLSAAILALVWLALDHPGWWPVERAMAGAGVSGLLLGATGRLGRAGDDAPEKMMTTTIGGKPRRAFPAPPGVAP